MECDFYSMARHHLGTMPFWLQIMGFVSLFLYGLIKLPFYGSTKHLDTALLLAGFACLFAYGGKSIKSSVPVWCALAAVLVTLATWLSGQITHPELIKSTPKLEHLANHFLFVVFAFWLMGSVQKTLVFWACAMASVVIAPWWLGGGWNELALGWAGQRINLGIHNAQHTSVVMGSALIAWLVFAKRMFSSFSHRSLLALVWLTVAVLLCIGFVASQTRAAFIGMSLAMVLLVSGLLYFGFQSGQRLRYGTVAALVLLATVASVLLGQETLVARFAESAPAAMQIMAGNWDAVPPTSLGLRIHSWRAGLEWAAQYPLFGLGRNGGLIVMQNTEWLQAFPVSDFGHMHNSALEFLVRYGILGLSIYVVLMFWIANQAHIAWKCGIMPTDFYTFFWLFFIFYTFVNMFESFMFYSTGILPFTVVMAGLLGFIWQNKTKTSSPH